jgi:hypothetical protein
MNNLNFWRVFIAIAMFSFISIHCQSISYSVLPDKNYAAGFLLSQSNRSTSIPQGKLELGGEAKGEKFWRISQWWSINNDLTNAVYSKTGNTHTYQALVDGSRLTVDPVAGSISLGMSASKEYGLNGITTNPRVSGEAWPHLLLEQGLSRYDQVKISDKKELRMDLTYNVTKFVDMMPAGTTNTGLHCCMFNWYITVNNRNVNSPDYGKFFWFGLKYYDNRYDFAAEYAAQDAGKVGATDAFIYKPAMQPLMVTKTVIGQPKTVNVDILPFIISGFALAQSRGYLTNSTLDELFVGSTNIGWEVQGTYDVDVSILNLDMSYQYTDNSTPTRNIVYVKPNGTGDGSSWLNASSLTAAIAKAQDYRYQEYNQIWMSEGTYNLTDSIPFDFIRIYGGFKNDNSATKLADRDWSKYKTIIDGGGTVQPLKSTNGEAVIDGVVIQNGFVSEGYGGGLNIKNNCAVRNCVIRNNKAVSPTNTKGYGGGIYVNGLKNSIENCLLINNTSNGGSAMMFAANTFTDVVNCTMANNLSTQSNCGAAIATISGTSPNITRPYFYNCLAYNNKHVNNYSSITQGNGTINWSNPLISVVAQNSAFETTTTSLPWDAASGNIKFLRTAPVVSPKFVADSNIYGQTDVPADKASVLNDNYLSNFQITALSPCKNAGDGNRTTLNTDLANKARINSVVDMGAFEYEPLTNIQNTNTVGSTMSIYPNPTSDMLQIKSENEITSVLIYDLLGNLNTNQFNKASVNCTILSNGTYILKVTDNQKNTHNFRVIKK